MTGRLFSPTTSNLVKNFEILRLEDVCNNTLFLSNGERIWLDYGVAYRVHYQGLIHLKEPVVLDFISGKKYERNSLILKNCQQYEFVDFEQNHQCEIVRVSKFCAFNTIKSDLSFENVKNKAIEGAYLFYPDEIKECMFIKASLTNGQEIVINCTDDVSWEKAREKSIVEIYTLKDFNVYRLLEE